MAKSLTEAGDLSFLADLLLLAGIEGVGGTGDIQRHIGIGVAIFPLLGAIGLQGGSDQEVDVAGQVMTGESDGLLSDERGTRC